MSPYSPCITITLLPNSILTVQAPSQDAINGVSSKPCSYASCCIQEWDDGLVEHAKARRAEYLGNRVCHGWEQLLLLGFRFGGFRPAFSVLRFPGQLQGLGHILGLSVHSSGFKWNERSAAASLNEGSRMPFQCVHTVVLCRDFKGLGLFFQLCLICCFMSLGFHRFWGYVMSDHS